LDAFEYNEMAPIGLDGGVGCTGSDQPRAATREARLFLGFADGGQDGVFAGFDDASGTFR
jgi:hypothetical protein